MGAGFDKWALLKIFEVGFTIACIVCKRVTDDEASRLFLYLQKLSREWSLLNNVTWDQIGSAVADATYGGYIIITAALLIGRVAGELPTEKRIVELVLLGIGAFLYIVIGSLEFASLDSVPPDLVDNAAVIGSLTLITALLFLLDMGGPKARRTSTQSQTATRSAARTTGEEQPRRRSQIAYDIEEAVERTDRRQQQAKPKTPTGGSKKGRSKQNGINGGPHNNNNNNNNINKTKEHHQQPARRFDIYGKDAVDYGNDSETDVLEDDHSVVPPRNGMERHSPVWSRVRYGPGQYGKYDVVIPSYHFPRPQARTEEEEDDEEEERPPSGPGDPGYVQYTAQRWGQPIQKAPKSSPTQV